MEQRVVSQLSAIDVKLDGVASDVSDLKSNSDLFRQQILGDVDGESPHGRVPKLENDLVLERAERLEVHKRVVSLELWRTQYKAYGVIVIAVSGLVSSVLSSIIAGLALMMLKSYLEGLKH
jgi:hypothetical protein